MRHTVVSTRRGGRRGWRGGRPHMAVTSSLLRDEILMRHVISTRRGGRRGGAAAAAAFRGGARGGGREQPGPPLDDRRAVHARRRPTRRAPPPVATAEEARATERAVARSPRTPPTTSAAPRPRLDSLTARALCAAKRCSAVLAVRSVPRRAMPSCAEVAAKVVHGGFRNNNQMRPASLNRKSHTTKSRVQ